MAFPAYRIDRDGNVQEGYAARTFDGVLFGEGQFSPLTRKAEGVRRIPTLTLTNRRLLFSPWPTKRVEPRLAREVS